MSSLSEVEGHCVVCGGKTYTRCSDCAANGTHGMFFCSIEHKKLIFYVHKRVCGIRSRPFQWPGLSPEEYRDTMIMSKQRMYNREGEVSTWFERFSKNNHVSGSDAEETFRAEINRYRDPGKGKRVGIEQRLDIVKIREMLWNSSAAIEHFATGTSERVPEDKLMVFRTGLPRRPFDFVVAALEGTAPELAANLENTRCIKWSTSVFHKYMIYAAIAAISMTDTSEEIRRNLAYTRKALIACVRELIPSEERTFAGGILESIHFFPPQAGQSWDTML